MDEVALVQCNLEYNLCQQKSKVLCLCVKCLSNNLVFLKTCNFEFDEIIIIFTDQNGRPLEIEDKVNLTLLINK